MVNTKGLNAEARKALEKVSRDFQKKYGVPLPVSSAFRTRQEQQNLWNNRHNNPYPVAQPGHSAHETGFAIDVTDPRARAMLQGAGFNWFGPGDAVHYTFGQPKQQSPLLAKANEIQAKTKAGAQAMAKQAQMAQQAEQQQAQMEMMAKVIGEGTKLQIAAEKNSIQAGKPMPTSEQFQQLGPMMQEAVGLQQPQVESSSLAMNQGSLRNDEMGPAPQQSLAPIGNPQENYQSAMKGVMAGGQSQDEAKQLLGPQPGGMQVASNAGFNPQTNVLQGGISNVDPGIVQTPGRIDIPSQGIREGEWDHLPSGKPTTQTSAMSDAIAAITDRLKGNQDLSNAISAKIPSVGASISGYGTVSAKELPNVWGNPGPIKNDMSLFANFIKGTQA